MIEPSPSNSQLYSSHSWTTQCLVLHVNPRTYENRPQLSELTYYSTMFSNEWPRSRSTQGHSTYFLIRYLGILYMYFPKSWPNLREEYHVSSYACCRNGADVGGGVVVY